MVKGGFIGPPPKFCCNLKVKSMVFIPLTMLMFILLILKIGSKKLNSHLQKQRIHYKSVLLQVYLLQNIFIFRNPIETKNPR